MSNRSVARMSMMAASMGMTAPKAASTCMIQSPQVFRLTLTTPSHIYSISRERSWYSRSEDANSVQPDRSCVHGPVVDTDTSSLLAGSPPPILRVSEFSHRLRLGGRDLVLAIGHEVQRFLRHLIPHLRLLPPAGDGVVYRPGHLPLAHVQPQGEAQEEQPQDGP